MTPPLGPDDREASGTQVKTVGSGRYELGRQLGRGGMAEVLMAHDVRLGRTVAVKTLRPDLAQDPVARSRFGREAQNAASLNHPAIVSVYDTGEDMVGGELVPFIVMECVEGRTVRELLGEGNPIPLEQALRITEGILEALEYSHHHGIIHRDIKPANVIITNSGAVKVMDFGIARAMHSAATTMTQTGMVMGTPQYLSPEQALGRTVDARSDLYSSGCLLYELLALRPPFNGDTPLSVVYQHVQDDPRPPSMADPRVPPHLDAIALKALAKNPEDRYQTADEMRMDIRRALAGQQVSVTVPPRVPTQNQRPAFASWNQAASGQSGTAEATAAMPSLTGRTEPQQAPPGHGGEGGGTGRLPAVPPSTGPGKRRRMPLYLFAVLAVLLVILGTILIVKNRDDDPAGGTNTPGVLPTESVTQSTSDGGDPSQPDNTLPVKPQESVKQNTSDDYEPNWGDNRPPNPTPLRPTYTAPATNGQTSGDPSTTASPTETASTDPTSPPVTSQPSQTDDGGSSSGGNNTEPASPPPGGGSNGSDAGGGTSAGNGTTAP